MMLCHFTCWLRPLFHIVNSSISLVIVCSIRYYYIVKLNLYGQCFGAANTKKRCFGQPLTDQKKDRLLRSFFLAAALRLPPTRIRYGRPADRTGSSGPIFMADLGGGYGNSYRMGRVL